jgi:H+-translocating NAD(P) transhydrogenase
LEAGAVVLSKQQVLTDADIITKVRPPAEDEVPMLAGKTLISTIQPAINGDLYKTLTEQKTNVFALDCVPRMLSRGQTYDTLRLVPTKLVFCPKELDQFSRTIFLIYFCYDTQQ